MILTEYDSLILTYLDFLTNCMLTEEISDKIMRVYRGIPGNSDLEHDVVMYPNSEPWNMNAHFRVSSEAKPSLLR